MSFSDKGKAVQQQTDNAQQPTKAFVASVNNLNEISHEPALISQDSSATMQDLIKVLTSMSPEALTASIGEVRELVHLYDVSQLIGGPPKIEEQKNMLQLIYGPPKMEEQPGLILEGRVTPPKSEIGTISHLILLHACSQARHIMTYNNFVIIGRKMSRNITAMSFDAGEPNLNSFTSKVKHPRVEENIALLEEIKEINNLLLDTQVVIGEKDNIGSTAGGYAKQSEGLVVKFMFNAITVNQDLISRYGTDKKSIINPLWLLVPSNYPFSSPVILDDKPWEASSEDLKDLTVKAKAKLKFSFRSLNQPWSLKDIALSWERCAREAITEYAHAFGGGTFTSKYGGWETC
ncbi:putative mediator of RNA polymerase II transcription subunit [Sesbania bispinosa]|nr:putative mediator of RNA polymerase II transcription subunit [Sesbania bispinosa]